jgi:hypothetical protein
MNIINMQIILSDGLTSLHTLMLKHGAELIHALKKAGAVDAFVVTQSNGSSVNINT